jgi:DNA-directed RNA polymerase specialized sigma54-like protein
VRTSYLKNKQHCDETLKAHLAQQNIQYFHANIDQALDQALVDFLSVRNSNHGRKT